MSLYELVFIVRQEVSPIRAKELAKKVSEFISNKGGKIRKEEYWGFKTLAYQIKKSSKAITIDLKASFILCHFLIIFQKYQEIKKLFL